MEPYDPTLDEMLCFYKPPLRLEQPHRYLTPDEDPAEPLASAQLPSGLASFVKTAPQVLLQGIVDAIDGLLDTLPTAVAIFKESRVQNAWVLDFIASKFKQ